MKAERCAFVHLDRAGKIVHRAASRAEKQHFGSWVECTQERLGFLKSDRCGRRSNGTHAGVHRFETLLASFGHVKTSSSAKRVDVLNEIGKMAGLIIHLALLSGL